MRTMVVTRMPVLSARIHRFLEPDSEPALLPPIPVESWNWSDAEDRLREAYDKDGLAGWAEAVMRETEAEGRLEQLRVNQQAADRVKQLSERKP